MQDCTSRSQKAGSHVKVIENQTLMENMDLSRTPACEFKMFHILNSWVLSDILKRWHESSSKSPLTEPLITSEWCISRISRTLKKKKCLLVKHVSHMDFKISLRDGKWMGWRSLLGHPPNTCFRMGHLSCQGLTCSSLKWGHRLISSVPHGVVIRTK